MSDATALFPDDTLYPNWVRSQSSITSIPRWYERCGLKKNRALTSMARASAQHWQQAETDGLKNLQPIIILFNKPPTEIKKTIGRTAWRRLHHATLTSNIDVFVLRTIGGWTWEEALQYPQGLARRAKSYLHEGYRKSAILSAARLTRTPAEFGDLLITANDILRMNGEVDPTWGRKRLRREHDAQTLQHLQKSTDPTPWAKAWFYDVDGYSFSLLKSETELALEGATQRHCGRSYTAACREGSEIVLRIEGTERGTASWRISSRDIQIRGFANSSLSPACHAATIEARRAFRSAQRSNAKPTS